MIAIKKVIKILLDIVIYVLIGMLILYLCLVMYQKTISKSELLNIKDYYIFQIASSSMEADLHVGDYIVVKQDEEYEVGDVITYKEDGYYITHRIHKIEEGKIVTKGDANASLDESITKEQILGKVLFKLTILSFVIKYKYIIVAIIISSFILEAVFKKEEKEKNIVEEDEE